MHHRPSATSGTGSAPTARVARRLAPAAGAALLALAFVPAAFAAGEKDKEAMKLHDSAMNEDYLSVEFAKAEKKLTEALKKCGKDGCSAEVLGKLHISMGIVKSASGDQALAQEEFVAALKADPKAAIPPELQTPENKKAFEAAQQAAGAGAAPSGGETAPPPEERPKEAPKKPAGDLTHTAAAEQAVNTPVPVYIEVPEEVGAAKATLRYKPFGGTKWKSIDMRPVGDGFGAEIPCEDVTTTGDVKYYIIVKDDTGEQVATAGSLKDPYKVPIKHEIEGEPPALPGKKPPQKCAAKEDCPPGLPGCPDGKSGGPRGDKGWGASCEQTQECQAGFVCSAGTCQEGKEEDTGEKPTGKGKRNVIGLWGALDMLLISGAEDVCSARTADGEPNVNYACFNTDGTQFYGEPAAVPGTNGIEGGFGVAGARLLVSYDRQFFQKVPITFGLRAGFAFGGSPSSDTPPPYEGAPSQAKSFLPVHAELRAAYVFGGSPFELRKIRPYAFLGGGLAQVNGSVPVEVCDLRNEDGKKLTKNGESNCAIKGKPTERRRVDAYQITGLNFIGVGFGATYGITENVGVGAELKIMMMVPTFGVVFAPTLGPVVAF